MKFSEIFRAACHAGVDEWRAKYSEEWDKRGGSSFIGSLPYDMAEGDGWAGDSVERMYTPEQLDAMYARWKIEREE